MATTNDDRIKEIARSVRTEDEYHVGDAVHDTWQLADVVALMVELGNQLDEFSAVKTRLQKAYDHLRIAVIPELMDEQGIKSANLEGIGRVTLTSDAYVNCPADSRQDLQRWLVDNGFDDMIQETVNASTLKAWALKRIRAGEDVPDFLKVTPFSRASVTRV
jgi:hypothetical protein